MRANRLEIGSSRVQIWIAERLRLSDVVAIMSVDGTQRLGSICRAT
jgi:hypothetical protein